jgi:1-acyl-sn-glycerol-3-phosphate acyltransferase
MKARFATWLLKLIGWRAVFSPPPGPKSVVVVYPHTSNWDFPLGVLFRAKHRVPMQWAGKDTLFRWPFGKLFLWLGGVPINRRQPTGMIRQLADAFAANETLSLCIAPEGTRSKTDHWKTGFYRLALEADVPVGLAFIDYGQKRLGVERWITLSGDEEADLAMIRAYYAGITARYPEKAGEIRFNRSADASVKR